MNCLDPLLVEEMQREDFIDIISENNDMIDTFIDDEITIDDIEDEDTVIDAVMDDEDYDKFEKEENT